MLRTGGRVERDEVDVALESLQQLGERPGRGHVVVLAGDEGPLERDAPAGARDEVVARLDQLIKVVPGVEQGGEYL